jgi:ferric-dicitrate binding protein FerR (iron transport regulator)
VFACILVIPVLKSKDPIVATVATGRQRQKVLLPDGSTVWLNTQTRLRYSQGRDSVRRVELEGEAYFTVRHDAAHPFIVHTARLEIADLGTSFDVKAYPGDRAAEATLIEGSIEVRLSGQLHGSASGHPPYAAVLNRPRQKIIALVETGTRETGSESVDGESVVGESVGDESGGSESVGGGRTASGNAGSGKAGVEKITVVRDSARTGDHADSLLAETAWMKNMLVFRNESFGDLALRMERWYGVRILFTDSLPARYRFTGALAGEGLEQALEELRLMKPFSYTITGGSVTIKK